MAIPRVVIDTNVIVAALLNPGRTPDLALSQISAGGAIVVYDERIAQEYREVIGRRKFAKVAEAGQARIASLLAAALRIEPPRYDGPLIDDDDRLFVEVAIASEAVALITGNSKHYPRGLGFDVLSPAEWLMRCS